jgi:hypothetical protein
MRPESTYACEEMNVTMKQEICEAASRPSMRYVPIKTAAQLEVQGLGSASSW